MEERLGDKCFMGIIVDLVDEEEVEYREDRVEFFSLESGSNSNERGRQSFVGLYKSQEFCICTESGYFIL